METLLVDDRMECKDILRRGEIAGGAGNKMEWSYD
jgi:hypothetical protein